MRHHPIQPRKYFRDGKTRWRVHVPDDLESENNARDRHFSRERDAVEFARHLTEARKSLVGTFLKMKQQDQEDIIRIWNERKTLKSTPLSLICRDCMESKRAAGIRKNSLAALKCATSSLIEFLADKSVESITMPDIDKWLASRADWSPKTKLNNYKFASSVFNWCFKRKIIKDNPCIGVTIPIVPFKGVSILTVPQIRVLLETCQKGVPALIGFIVLVIFAGLRVAESARCLPSNIANGVIDLGGDSTKLNIRRCIKITPQLAAWLALPGVEIGGKHIHQRMRELQAASGVTIPKNALRHSFCSYSLELYGADATARAANNSPAMLFRHYAAMVSLEDAKAFAEILPEMSCQDAESLVTSSPAT